MGSFRKGDVFQTKTLSNKTGQPPWREHEILRMRTPVTEEDMQWHKEDVKRCWHDDGGEPKLAPMFSYVSIPADDKLVVVSGKAGRGYVEVYSTLTGRVGAVHKKEVEEWCEKLS